MYGRFYSFRLLTFSLFLLLLSVGCGEGGGQADDLFLAAAEALGQEAYAGRERVVNPHLIAPENPLIPERVLSEFREGGFEIMEGVGEEDPTKATLYFSLPRPLEGSQYEIRIYVSMGARFGSMDRGDTWWRVIGECVEGCRVLETIQTDNEPWS